MNQKKFTLGLLVLTAVLGAAACNREQPADTGTTADGPTTMEREAPPAGSPPESPTGGAPAGPGETGAPPAGGTTGAPPEGGAGQ